MTRSITKPALSCALLLTGLVPVLATAQEVQVPAPVLEAQQRRIEVIQRAAPAVVAIFAAGGKGGGSGVIISPDGFAVTNFHVVEGAGSFMQCGLNDGKVYDAVLVGIDPTGDVAVIQLLGRDDFPTAVLGNSDDVQVGDWTFAMGNPFLLAEDLQPTVTFGM
ncbi:MAG: trypsin-like peptidase domain-containing protein, partial [Planctomycetaceae bacterium]|nr:trypsin-like peptidase domain-containing protein [Planctomycetaceae bacterium]